MRLNSTLRQYKLAMMMIAVVVGVSWSQDRASDRRDEFLAALEQLIPKQLDPIIVTYEAPGHSAGISTAGYDAASGAWFSARQNGYAGITPDGRYFRTDQHDIKLDGSQSFYAVLMGIAEEIPWCFLISMRSYPDMVVGAELDKDGVWNVLYHAIEPSRIEDERAPWLLRVDAETGHVLSNRWTVSKESPITEFDWNGTTVGMRTKSRNSADRIRTFLDDHAELSEFEPERVSVRTKEYQLRVDQKLTALSSGYIQTDEGEWVLDEHAQHVESLNDPLTRRFRTPLVIGGVLVLLVAVVQIIRKDRTQ